MLKSRMTFVVREINKTENFFTTKLSMKVSQVVFVWCQSSHTHTCCWLIDSKFFTCCLLHMYDEVTLLLLRPFVPSFHYFRSARVKARGADGQNVSNMHWDVAGARVDLPIEHEGQRRLQFTRRFLTREVSNLPFARAVPPVHLILFRSFVRFFKIIYFRAAPHGSARGADGQKV